MPSEQRKSRDGTGFSEAGDPLCRASRVQQHAAALNFDWPDVHGAIAKLREEIAELDAVLAGSASAGERGTADEEVRDEIGDLLFAAVNVARLAGVPADDALADATTKFERRFGELLGLAGRLGMDPRAASLEELEALWQRVKADEG
ncbi:MAG: MazG nucleotide pyrophosphohydrolase domain-containing protein [Gemmatimonadota bacterium]